MVIERPPFRPFRLIAQATIGLVAALIILVTLSFTEGWRLGPAESIRFESRQEALAGAFSDQGVEWPGTTTVIHDRADGSFVVERKWLVWSEIRLRVSDNLVSDSAAYEYGTGTGAQKAIILGFSCISGCLVFLLVRRAWRQYDVALDRPL